MKNLLWVLALLLAHAALAQTDEAAVPMADALRADGKIWVVVATVLIVLFGLLGYVIYVDRRIARLEKNKRA